MRSNSWRGHQRKRRRPVRGARDLVPLARQPAFQHVAVGGVVVDDEDTARVQRLARGAACWQRLHGPQHVGKEVELLRPGGAFGRLGQLPAGQRRHGVDLAEELVGGGFELGEVGAQRTLGSRLHVLEQKLAVAFDGVERRAQIVPQATIEFFEGLVLAPIGRCILDQTFHECV